LDSLDHFGCWALGTSYAKIVARIIARLMRAFTNPLETECGCSHFAASRSAGEI
jgi:hypothetical protein